jgi:hypothetical protein
LEATVSLENYFKNIESEHGFAVAMLATALEAQLKGGACVHTSDGMSHWNANGMAVHGDGHSNSGPIGTFALRVAQDVIAGRLVLVKGAPPKPTGPSVVHPNARMNSALRRVRCIASDALTDPHWSPDATARDDLRSILRAVAIGLGEKEGSESGALTGPGGEDNALEPVLRPALDAIQRAEPDAETPDAKIRRLTADRDGARAALAKARAKIRQLTADRDGARAALAETAQRIMDHDDLCALKADLARAEAERDEARALLSETAQRLFDDDECCPLCRHMWHDHDCKLGAVLSARGQR